MVHLVRILGAAAILSIASAAPMPRPEDSAIGAEIAVSAPDGTPTSDPPTSTATANNAVVQTPEAPAPTQDWSSQGNYGGSQGGYGSAYGGGGYGNSYGGGYGSQGGDSSWQTEVITSWKAEATYFPTYGSGSESWGGSGYNDCVQQCAASYGSPGFMAPSPTQEESGGWGGSSGSNGVTHTIIVAPSQGVLRYVPFSVNASVGDTVSFQWRAGPHTVSRSSALEVCNKTSNNFFTSGQQQNGFTYNEVVNDTKPIWIYCGVQDHCQKGMFMGINIGQADPGSDSVPLGSMISNITEMSSDMSAMWSYTKSQTGSDSYANGWGMGTNLAGMSQEAMMQTAQNVMYMQTLIAKNPSNVKNGQFLASDNMVMPMDLQQALASTSANPAGASGASAGGVPSSPSSAANSAASNSATPPNNAATSGAGSIASSSVAVGLVAVVATFFAL